MRARLVQSGLIFVSLLLVALAIAGAQGPIRRSLGAQGAWAMAALVLLVYTLAARFVERRRPTELAPRAELPRLLAGVGLGLALFAGVVAILWAVGAWSPAGAGAPGGLAGLGPGLAVAAASGVIEEVLFRGLLYRLFERLTGTWGALLVVSALFGAAHLANPGATAASALAIAVEAGLLLGAAYATTGGLGLPIGIHIGWNFCEGSVFGLAVSGHTPGRAALPGVLSGPTALTGGDFGPEGSVLAVALCLCVAGGLLWRMVSERRAVPPIWSRALRAPLPTAPAP